MPDRASILATNDQAIPTITPGFYWARSRPQFAWYNLIVKVTGTIPFLHIVAWNLSPLENKLESVHDPSAIIWGPRIDCPEVPACVIQN